MLLHCNGSSFLVISQVLKVISTKITVFRDVAPGSQVDVYRLSRKP